MNRIALITVITGQDGAYLAELLLGNDRMSAKTGHRGSLFGP